ncbi:leucine-rich repeat-containing protein 52-like isoform X2 [Embiotoca jacksoni]|uniref:leucine-rich repeat-containing protein 52-like isoform X2 n=1 Tax=Embiotoca jacksoni TaxID=100190 RepID=UPI0037049ED2
MRLAPQPCAQLLRLIVLILVTAGVITSPVLSSGCPDRCVCDDQLVVQCAGQHLTTFPVNLPLATRQLIISNNRIVELPPLALNYLSDLVYLDCSNNSLTEISESTFGNLRKLAYLDLSFNTLTRIEDRTFGPLASLVMLRMTDNPGLSEIHPDAFAENAALQVLDVSRNNLTVLNITSLIALPTLRSVGLSGNPWSCECDNEDLCLWVHLEGFKFQGLTRARQCVARLPTCRAVVWVRWASSYGRYVTRLWAPGTTFSLSSSALSFLPLAPCRRG